MSDSYTPSERTRLVREPQRAIYDRAAAYRILDEGFICHVGFVADGQAFVIPTGPRTGGRQPLHSWIGREPHATPPG